MDDLKRDLLIILISICLAVTLTQLEIIDDFLDATQSMTIFSSLVAGVFFTSIFTIAPASVALAEIGQISSPSTVALFGALGAVVGDLIILYFIRDMFMEDMKGVFKKRKLKKFLSFFHLGLWRWLLPIIGAAIIASPLPDELGLTIMGVSKIKTPYLLPIVFVMNYFGVLLIIAVGKMI